MQMDSPWCFPLTIKFILAPMGAGLWIFTQHWKRPLSEHLEDALNFVPVKMELIGLQLEYIMNTEVTKINQQQRSNHIFNCL